MSNSLFEAFQTLGTLNEDTFNVTDDGIAKLKEFENGGIENEVETIIDPLAETDEDLKASYLGKAILNCIICQSKIYKDPSEIVLSEDGDLVNVGEECPYCQSPDGYKVIGQVAEFNPKKTDEVEEIKVEDEIVEPEEETDLDEAIKTKKGATKLKSMKEDLEREFTVSYNRDDFKYGSYGAVRVKATNEEEAKSKFLDSKKDSHISDVFVRPTTDEDVKKGIRLIEDFNRVDIETDTSKMTMESDESGKVTVTTEPKDEEITDVQVDVTEEPVYQDYDIDEFDETEFDELGESYLKKIYENVASYKTTKGSLKDETLKLEGIIKFKSGKEAKTNFIFESKSVTKTGKLKLVGENQQFAKGKKSFTLTGRVDGKKLVTESLTYNYRAKDSKTGISKRLYGTVSSKK